LYNYSHSSNNEQRTAANHAVEPTINPEFEVHVLNADGVRKAKQIAADFNAMLNILQGMLPSGRELSIVKTKLEEACFFAKKGIAKQVQNQL
jgi:hypothetical protein